MLYLTNLLAAFQINKIKILHVCLAGGGVVEYWG